MHWAPNVGRRFSAVQAVMREKEEELQEKVARRQDENALVPITDVSLEEQYFFYRKLGRLGDYDLLTVEDMLTVAREPAGYDNTMTIDEVLDFFKARSAVRGRDNTIRTPPSAPGPVGKPSVWSSPMPTPPAESDRVPAGAASLDLCLTAARAALSSEVGTRFKRSTTQQRRQAWFRLVKEATIQLETLKTQGTSSILP